MKIQTKYNLQEQVWVNTRTIEYGINKGVITGINVNVSSEKIILKYFVHVKKDNRGITLTLSDIDIYSSKEDIIDYEIESRR